MERVLVLAISEDTSEIRSLLDTLSISIVEEFVQNRSFPHRLGFLGPGKLKEVEERAKELEFDAIVINGTLKPSQHHHLEMRFQKECIDRTGVILRIFADHAHTPEAIAQVTLARLRYELPFLREWIHKAKSGDRPGFLAGGAYATDIYFEHAKTQARRIEKNLADLSKQREVTRTKRHAKGYSLISLAGYTNAGKSALFNALCGAQVEVDDRLFSTLSTTTRKVLGVPGNILMVDTVGFIKNLPPDLVDAFNSTLEEIFFADLILLVFDASENMSLTKVKLRTCTDILFPKIHDQSLIVLANKSDLLTKEELDKILSETSQIIGSYPMIAVSAKTGVGLEGVRAAIGHLQKRNLVIEAILPVSDGSLSLLSRLRSTCQVSEEYLGNRIKTVINCKDEDGQRIIGMLRKVRAIKVDSHQEGPETGQGTVVSTSKGSEGAPLV
jgi:GTPase